MARIFLVFTYDDHHFKVSTLASNPHRACSDPVAWPRSRANPGRKGNPMKAFVLDRYAKKGVLRPAEVPAPSLGDDEVLVENRAAG